MKIKISIAILFFALSFVYSQEEATHIEKAPTVTYDSTSQITPLVFDKNLLEKYVSDPRFDYTEKINEANWWHQFKTWISKVWTKLWTWLFGDYGSNSFLIFLYHALPYIIMGSVILFLIWLFYKINPGSKFLFSKDPPELFYTDEEEIIKTKDIQKLIDEALKNNDYRLAVRYQFLLVLKQLSETEIIDYQFDKTNADYVSEIKIESLALPFKKVAKLYEYIWYGSFSIAEQDFSKIRPQFTELQSKIHHSK